MLKTVARVSALVLMVASGYTAAALKIGQPAPDFSGIDTQGIQHLLSHYRGKTLVLEWTNHDCPYVRKHYGSGNTQRQQAAAAKQDVRWFSIISSAPGRQGHVSPKEADRLTLERNARPHAVLLDPEGLIGRRYGATTTPHMFVIDAQGSLRYMGAIDDLPTAEPMDVERATQYVEVALTELLAGKPVTTPVSQPNGCSVKY